jgi:ERF superfamily
VLAQHGLVLVQALEDGEGGTLLVSSALFHAASGQWLSSELSVEKHQNMQDFGAVAIYAKRYSMQSLLNVSGEDDDDAAGVSEPASAQVAAAPVVPSTKCQAPAPHAPAPAADPAHPTERDLAALRHLAVTECGEAPDVYEDRIRRLGKLPVQASVSPRLLARTLPIAVYRELYQYYETLLAQLRRPTQEVTDGAARTPHASTEPAAA